MIIFFTPISKQEIQNNLIYYRFFVKMNKEILAHLEKGMI